RRADDPARADAPGLPGASRARGGYGRIPGGGKPPGGGHSRGESRAGLAGVWDQRTGTVVGGGGVGLSGPIPDREGLVPAERSAVVVDTDVPGGRKPDGRPGAAVEPGVARADAVAVGGAAEAAAERRAAAGLVSGSGRPQDEQPQRGVVV